MEPGLPATAESCGRCHRAIHEAWKGSSHAAAMENRLFQDALELASAEFGAGARRVCLDCHSPAGARSGDYGLTKKVTWEGVTCDYCHSVQSVGFGGRNPVAIVSFSRTKSGPLKGSRSPAHDTNYSDVHTSSSICAPCHEYRNGLGFPVLTTYSEWKASRYGKQGRHCQSCHMGRVEGDVVDPRIQRSRHAKINLHQMPGSRSLTQLNATVKAKLLAGWENGRLRVEVLVANRGAGHHVPTGSPLRQLILKLQADSGDGRHFEAERIYDRKVADRQGVTITRESSAFLKAAKLISDTRLKPDEERPEVFLFDVPRGVRTDIKATFWYYYSPMARSESQKRITFLTLHRTVE